MITLVFVPAMYTLFEEGLSGLFKKGAPATRSSALTVFPVTGSTHSPATSASGASTKRRSRNRGCGTASPGSSHDPIPIQNQVEVERPRRVPVWALPAPLALDRQQRGQQFGGLERRLADHHPVQKGRLNVGTSTGSVSMKVEARSGWISRLSLATAKSRWACRSPRFEPRAMATGTREAATSPAAIPSSGCWRRRRGAR